MLGGARAQYHLRQVLLYLDAFVLNKPEIMIADAASKISARGELTDETTRRLIVEQLVALQALIQRVAAS
jgi:chromate reductase